MQAAGGNDDRAVSAARCSDYEVDHIRAVLDELLAPLGGMRAFVKPGERIALKPNILNGATPEQAIVTHPAVAAAVALAVRDVGAHPVIVESPGYAVHVRPFMERIFRKTGYQDFARRYDIELCLDTDWVTVSCPEARLAKRLEVIGAILRVDGVINLPKFKTHMFMIFSGATKNLFGVVPGLNKAGFHAKMPERPMFANMLLDIAYFIRPRLNIVDGILSMEGDGPGAAGKPRALGLLLAGADPVAVDAACCRIAGMKLAAVPILAAAAERGLWSGRAADVHTLGIPLAGLEVKDFVMPGTYEGIGVGSGGAHGTVWRILHGFNRRPRPQPGRCDLCATCERQCPAGAIRLDKRARVAVIDDSRCIRCYCCHELCPSAAVDLELKGTGRIAHRLGLLK